MLREAARLLYRRTDGGSVRSYGLLRLLIGLLINGLLRSGLLIGLLRLLRGAAGRTKTYSIVDGFSAIRTKGHNNSSKGWFYVAKYSIFGRIIQPFLNGCAS